MSDVVPFPGAKPGPEVHTERDEDEIHAEAFRDLEGRISDCALMAHIAVGLAEPFINNRDYKAEQALFAVCHVYEMLKKLNADYQAAWYGKKQGPS
jgi:hypothetical protein